MTQRREFFSLRPAEKGVDVRVILVNIQAASGYDAGMKNTTIAKFLSAALLSAAVAGAPALASAATSATDPVQINSFQFASGNRDTNGSSLTVSYTNENASPATNVIFAATSDGQLVNSFEDTGTFSQGVSIDHTFLDLDATEDALQVEMVTFADGTVWINPQFS